MVARATDTKIALCSRSAIILLTITVVLLWLCIGNTIIEGIVWCGGLKDILQIGICNVFDQDDVSNKILA
jgi:hypothetical protein